MVKSLNLRAFSDALPRAGLSPAKLAEKLGVSREAVSKWLHGESIPTPDKLLRLGKILGLKFEELVITDVPEDAPIVEFRRKTARKKLPTRLTEYPPLSRMSLGSVLNVTKYLPFYTKGAKPRFLEGDPFVTIIPLPDDSSRSQAAKQVSTKTREKTREKILHLLRAQPRLTTAELAVTIGITDKGVAWQLDHLSKDGLLRRIGPDKGGHWEVLEATR